jgi:regulator of sigma E protease
MNLLPIPVLDGGLILFSLIAMIMRRRIPEKIVAPVTMFFMYLLMALMAFLVIRDFWIIGKRAAKDSEAVRQSQETQREEAPPDGD